MSEEREKSILDQTLMRSLPKYLFLVSATVAIVAIAFVLINYATTYFTAKSYVEQIADAFDLSNHLAQALTIVVFALLAFFASKLFSFQRSSRTLGYLGILSLLVANSVLLWRGSEKRLFDRNGNAVKCYVLNKDGIHYSEHPGIDPETGRVCRAVTPQIVEKLRAYEKGLKPHRLTDQNPAFFDALTGEPIVWYTKLADGQIELFDLMGYHPDTGEELLPITRAIADKWKEQQSAKTEARCYIIVGNTVRYGNAPGLDPLTGKECREIKPGLIERLRAYEQGKRPNRLTGKNITYFDPRTGAPIVWYAKTPGGQIELFDLMGFHPRTGQELLPITSEIADEYQSQERKLVARAPQRVDATDYAFFDPVTGEPRAWYWKSPDGTFEFFDGPGFHPRTGDPLSVVTKTILEDLKRQDNQKKIELQKKSEEIKEKKKDEATLAEAENKCDQLAGNPTDTERNPAFHGRSWDELLLVLPDAVDACEKAISNAPNIDRYKYQLARAYQSTDRQKAMALYEELVARNYAAAFDNYAWVLLLQKPEAIGAAEQYFRKGAALGNPDAMESLAELINKKKIRGRDRQEAYRLMQQAAELGNQDAQKFLAEYQEREDEKEQKKIIMKQIFQGIFGSVAR